MDQEVFFVTALLNPFFGQERLGLGAATAGWQGGYFAVVEKVYRRMMGVKEGEDVPEELFDAWAEYFTASGKYDANLLNIDQWRKSALKNG